MFSSTPGYPFEKDLYISSDGRLVFEPVGEIDLESAETEAQQSRAILERLKRDEPPRLGPASAPVIVVMYVDFQCGYCKRAEKVLRERIFGAHDENLQVLFKHHPLASHSWSRAAARDAACLYKRSNELFWKFSEFVFQQQADIDSENVATKIGEFIQGAPGIDRDAFQSCVASTLPDMVVLRDENSAFAAGVRATPTFFVDGRKIIGMGDEAEFLRLLDRREAIAKRDRSAAVEPH